VFLQLFLSRGSNNRKIWRDGGKVCIGQNEIMVIRRGNYDVLLPNVGVYLAEFENLDLTKKATLRSHHDFSTSFSSVLQATSELEISKLSLVDTCVCTCKNSCKKVF
jgi:hypothetical protein